DWGDIYANDNATYSNTGRGDDQDWRDYQQANLRAAPDLHAHLGWQADMHPFTPLQREAASHIIDAIDDNGLLAGWDDVRDDLTQDPSLTPDAVESVLASIQAFDPPGIGARGLAECLAIQLHQIDAETEGLVLALNLVENGHLDALARGPELGSA